MTKNPKNMRRLSEVAAQHYCHEILGCIKTVRAVKTQWQRQDMFSCDILGKRANGSWCCVQVTAGQSQAVTARKRKLEAEIWHDDDTVQLLRLVREGKKWYFRVYEYYKNPSGSYIWLPLDPLVDIPEHWFKKCSKKVER